MYTSPANPSGVRTIRNQYEPRVKVNGDFDFLNTKLPLSTDPWPLILLLELIVNQFFFIEIATNLIFSLALKEIVNQVLILTLAKYVTSREVEKTL